MFDYALTLYVCVCVHSDILINFSIRLERFRFDDEQQQTWETPPGELIAAIEEVSVRKGGSGTNILQ